MQISRPRCEEAVYSMPLLTPQRAITPKLMFPLSLSKPWLNFKKKKTWPYFEIKTSSDHYLLTFTINANWSSDRLIKLIGKSPWHWIGTCLFVRSGQVPSSACALTTLLSSLTMRWSKIIFWAKVISWGWSWLFFFLSGWRGGQGNQSKFPINVDSLILHSSWANSWIFQTLKPNLNFPT